MMQHLCRVACVIMAPVAAHAQALHRDVNGSRLDIALSCAEEVTVLAYAGLHDRVIMDATAKNQEELDQLDLLEGPRVRLQLKASGHGSDRCWRPVGAGGFEPTLRIQLEVPENAKLAIDTAGSGMFHVAVGGQLWLDLSGSASLDATTVTMLNLNLSGSGRVSIGQLNGRAQMDLGGSGDVHVKRVESEEVAINQAGSASVEIGDGSITALSVTSGGSGDIAIGAMVTDAAVEASGSSNVSIRRVTGKLVKTESGSGEVRMEQKR